MIIQAHHNHPDLIALYQLWQFVERPDDTRIINTLLHTTDFIFHKPDHPARELPIRIHCLPACLREFTPT